MKKNKTISRYSLFALQILFFGGSAGYVYPSLIIRSTESAYWMPIVLWALLALIGVWLYKLAFDQTSTTLVKSLQHKLGLILTILLTAPVMLFIVGVGVVMLRAYTEMISMTMLPSTPIPFLNGLIVVPVFMAWAGIMPIIRSARVFFLLTLMVSIFLMFLGLSDIQLSLGSPWLRTNGDFFKSIHFYQSSYLWSGFVFIALFKPYTGEAVKRFWQPAALAICCVLPLILGVVYLPILTFGPELSKQLILPYVSKMDSIYYYWIVFENMTAVLVSNMMIYVLLSLSLKLHVLGKMIIEIFPEAKKSWVYITLGIIVYSAANLVPSWRELENLMYMMTFPTLYAMFAFPLIALIVFQISNFAKRRKDDV